MALSKSSNLENTTEECFVRVYQHSDGTYLPDSSQPDPNKDFEITSRQYTPHECTRYINVILGTDNLAQKKNKEGKCVNTETKLPELYKRKELCCGCTACYAICPVSAILMRPDEEGFLYPVVDAQKCIRCYKCMSVCPIKRKDQGES